MKMTNSNTPKTIPVMNGVAPFFSACKSKISFYNRKPYYQIFIKFCENAFNWFPRKGCCFDWGGGILLPFLYFFFGGGGVIILFVFRGRVKQIRNLITLTSAGKKGPNKEKQQDAQKLMIAMETSNIFSRLVAPENENSAASLTSLIAKTSFALIPDALILRWYLIRGVDSVLLVFRWYSIKGEVSVIPLGMLSWIIPKSELQNRL